MTAACWHTAQASASAVIPLWPGVPPGGGGPTGPEHVSAKGAVSRIGTPHLRVYRPAHANGASVLIAGGGGYQRIEMASEAAPAAHWLTARGITAFALLYRLPDEGWVAGPEAPLADAERAIRVIRAEMARFSKPAVKVGVLGFSAGGHLMGLAATRLARPAYAPIDATDRLSARPDNAALIYPVITLEPPYDDTATRRSLIGSDPSAATSAAWSVQTGIAKGCPPFFLVQAEDDSVSDPANTRIMAQACAEADVPVELHRLAKGGHGFGMGRPGTDAALWPGWYEAWLRRQFILD